MLTKSTPANGNAKSDAKKIEEMKSDPMSALDKMQMSDVDKSDPNALAKMEGVSEIKSLSNFMKPNVATSGMLSTIKSAIQTLEGAVLPLKDLIAGAPGSLMQFKLPSASADPASAIAKFIKIVSQIATILKDLLKLLLEMPPTIIGLIEMTQQCVSGLINGATSQMFSMMSKGLDFTSSLAGKVPGLSNLTGKA